MRGCSFVVNRVSLDAAQAKHNGTVRQDVSVSRKSHGELRNGHRLRGFELENGAREVLGGA